MIDPIQRVTLFVLYQLSIALGIVLLPIAVLAHRQGVTVPVHRIVNRLGAAYEETKHTA